MSDGERVGPSPDRSSSAVASGLVAGWLTAATGSGRSAVDSLGAADLENSSEPRLSIKGGRGSGASGRDLADLAQQLLGEFPALGSSTSRRPRF